MLCSPITTPRSVIHTCAGRSYISGPVVLGKGVRVPPHFGSPHRYTHALTVTVSRGEVDDDFTPQDRFRSRYGRVFALALTSTCKSQFGMFHRITHSIVLRSAGEIPALHIFTSTTCQ